MAREQAYLVRVYHTGLMSTVQAQSVDGAKRIFLADNAKGPVKRRLAVGDYFAIKPRLDDHADWQYFKVS